MQLSWQSMLIIYLAGINFIAFLLMGMDKKRARKKEWRISEKALFMSAFVGGSVGAIAGMYCFRHKTKHWYFVWGMPAILMVQLIVAVVVLKG